MNDNISFRKMKAVMLSKGFKGSDMAEKLGIRPNEFSGIVTGARHPKTDLLARICSILEVYPSEIVAFDNVEIKGQYFTNDKREPLPKEYTGELTYKPLWLFLADYLDKHEGKTANDLFDQIEPPRRVNGQTRPNYENVKKAVAARFGEGYVAQRTNRNNYTKGLPAATRTKLRNDKPLNLSVIYEICKKLGCTIDFVLSYK